MLLATTKQHVHGSICTIPNQAVAKCSLQGKIKRKLKYLAMFNLSEEERPSIPQVKFQHKRFFYLNYLFVLMDNIWNSNIYTLYYNIQSAYYSKIHTRFTAKTQFLFPILKFVYSVKIYPN